MIAHATAEQLLDIVQRVYDCEQEREDDSIYWPDERKYWLKTIRRAQQERKS